MKKSILVVEDEFLIAEGILEDLKALGYAPLYPHCVSFEEGVQALQTHVPDLVLLDLRLQGEKSGSDLAAFIQEHYDIPYIFLTSHFNPRLFDADKALKPAGILTKPFHINNLFATIEFVLRQPASELEEKIVLPGALKKEWLIKKDFLFAEADQNYSRIHLKDRTFTVRIPLKELQKLLGPRSFQQVHRSYLVGLTHITGFKAGFVFVGAHKVPIGRRYKHEILMRLRGEE